MGTFFARRSIVGLQGGFGEFTLGRGPVHAVSVGFFGSLLVAMVTRVTQGHSGRPLVLGRIPAIAFVGMQAVAVLRIASEFASNPAPWFLADEGGAAGESRVEGFRRGQATVIGGGLGGMTSRPSPRAAAAQKTVLELLLSDAPDTAALKHDSELAHWADVAGARAGRFPLRAAAVQDLSHPAMAVNLDACIQCTRCIRACRDIQGNDVLGLAFRGGHAQIIFDQADPMGQSTCVACGECVQACPTGAIAPANGSYARVADKTVDSVCPYCGVGCQLTYHVKDGKIDHVEGKQGPANEGRLCVKGRFGFDYAHSPDRLTRPLIRRADAPKDAASVMRRDWRELFREASWDEALDLAARGFQAALAATLAAFQDHSARPGCSTKATHRLPGWLRFPAACARELAPVIEEINAHKLAFKAMVQAAGGRDEKFELVHGALPGVITLQVYRKLTLLTGELHSLGFTWADKQSISRLSREQVLEMLERSRRYVPALSSNEEWSKMVDQEVYDIRRLPADAQLFAQPHPQVQRGPARPR